MSAAQDEVEKLFADKEHRTSHPEDDVHSLSDRESDVDDSDRENQRPAGSPGAAAIRDGPANIPFRKAHGNTGPKGVIRDAQSHRSAQLKADSVASLSLKTKRHRDRGTHLQQPPHQRGTDSADGQGDGEEREVEEENLDDDGFMEQWRRARLRQLQNGAGDDETAAVVPVDGFGYLAAVDESDTSTVVVVYIYDESSEVSRAVESCLSKVARRASGRRRNVKFVKLRYQEAEMEPAGVPALLAYRNGEKFAGLVPLVDEIPDDAELSETTLEAMLQRHQIL